MPRELADLHLHTLVELQPNVTGDRRRVDIDCGKLFTGAHDVRTKEIGPDEALRLAAYEGLGYRVQHEALVRLIRQLRSQLADLARATNDVQKNETLGQRTQALEFSAKTRLDQALNAYFNLHEES